MQRSLTGPTKSGLTTEEYIKLIKEGDQNECRVRTRHWKW